MGSVDNYDVGQLLGSGGFAEVYRARLRSSQTEVAIKVIEKSKIKEANAIQRVLSEIKIQRSLRHPCILNLIDYFEDSRYVYIVLELCTYGNLYKYVKQNGSIAENDAGYIICQVLDALNYLHMKGIVHRDLKLSNILLTEKLSIKICDFGLAVQLSVPDEEHYTFCCTPNYIAPEVVKEQSHGFPADIWSVGCLFYYMVTGKPPFQDINRTSNATTQRTYNYNIPSHLSVGAKDFLHLLLAEVRVVCGMA